MKPIERWGVLVSTLVVTLTGLVYGWMKYLLTPADPWAVINHPLEPLVLKLHILSAPLLVFALGMIVVRHVWVHVRERVSEGRRSGLLAGLAAVPMIATGYVIQTVIHEGWLFWLAMAHIAAGVAFAVGVGLHWLVIKPARKRPGRGVGSGEWYPPDTLRRATPETRSQAGFGSDGTTPHSPLPDPPKVASGTRR